MAVQRGNQSLPKVLLIDSSTGARTTMSVEDGIDMEFASYIFNIRIFECVRHEIIKKPAI